MCPAEAMSLSVEDLVEIPGGRPGNSR